MPALLDPGARLIVAHRGNSARAPENTLEAFRQALALGVDGIEFDVRCTADGYAVVIHDPSVDRTTGGAGAVNAMTLAELRRLDAGHRVTSDGGRTFPWRDRGILVPTLEEVLAAFPGIPFILEIKTPDAATETRRVLERHGAAVRCIVASFDARTLAPFRGSAFALGASRDDVARLLVRALVGAAPTSVPYQALCIPPRFHLLPLAPLRLATAARAVGVPTHVWTIDDPALAARYWAGGVSAIITNDPSTLMAAAGRVPVHVSPSPVPAVDG